MIVTITFTPGLSYYDERFLWWVLFYVTGYSQTVREYETRYQRLRERGEAYTNWLDRIPREQYALAFDGGYRWGHMTTNLVECINSVLKGARNLSVTALVKATFYRLNELFTQKRAETEARINAGHVFSELVTSKLHANQRAAGNIQVSCFDRQNEVFEVRECPSGVEYAVDLRQQRCDCGEFQVDRLRVDMCLLVVQTNVLIGNCMYMMSTRWNRFDECTGLGLGHSGIQQHGLFIMDLDS
ncbi:hypothetical protein Ahy_B01g052779 [Arachis hypogaea]|uniref:Transposase MuDR plant domain-containing protein n=1 Tax=Arachis hypogaea TaxID=3818 RepID=A0A445AQB6_ARAHY|nr:hypothetical protein Ahy_B01g052779 [Arachis hypogaea]